MARVSKAVEQAETLLAAAIPQKVASRAPLKGGVERWQETAWGYYDTVGEFRAAVNWVGNVLSRAKLYAGRYENGSITKAPDNHPATIALAAFGGGTRGQRNMLHDYGVLYSVCGAAWTVGYEDANGRPKWVAVAPGEVTTRGDQILVDGEPIPSKSVVVQSWRPHPRKRSKADSPARSALPILREIHSLTNHVAAQTDSRLASAGVLLVPNEIAATTVGARQQNSAQVTSEQFVAKIQEVMARAIADRDDPAALVPIVLTGEAEHLDKVRLVEFWSKLDEQAINLRTEAIRRLALSLDMPPEILTGTGDVNHWGAWQIDESAIKSHTEPLLDIICYDLSVGYLHPAIEGEPDYEEWMIFADTSEMRLRPNRSAEAFSLWDRGLLTSDTLMRETGFAESDAPNKVQFIEWILRKMASGSTTPDIVLEAARALGVDIDVSSEAPTTQAPDSPSLDKVDRQVVPEHSALLAAAEQMVFRALERAGNRIKNRTGVIDGVGAPEMYLYVKQDHASIDDCLTDAWSNVGRFADTYGADCATLTAALDGYTRSIMAASSPYDRGTLATWLSR